MSTAVVVPRKSLSERVLHALLFEGLAVLLEQLVLLELLVLLVAWSKLRVH